MHSVPGIPKIVMVSAEKKFTGTIIPKSSTIICVIYNKTKEQANRNQNTAIFSKNLRKPTILLARYSKKSSTQTALTTIVVPIQSPFNN